MLHDTVACPFPFFMLECALKLAMNFFTYDLISFEKDALKDAFFYKVPYLQCLSFCWNKCYY